MTGRELRDKLDEMEEEELDGELIISNYSSLGFLEFFEIVEVTPAQIDQKPYILFSRSYRGWVAENEGQV